MSRPLLRPTLAASSIELLRAALASAERTGDAALVQDIWSYLIGAYAHGPMPLVEAERQIRAIVEMSPGLLVEAAAHRGFARLAAARGDFETARSLIRRGRDPLADAGLAVHHAGTSQVTAFIEALAGDPEAALRIAREGFDELANLGEHAYASTTAADIAWLLCDLGPDEESEGWIRKARELSPAEDASTLLRADFVEAVLRARRGESDEAEQLARRAVERAEGTDFWKLRGDAYEGLASALSAAGRRDEAREALRAALRVHEEKGSVVSADRMRALLAEL